MGCFLACFGSSKNKRSRKPPPVSSSSSAPSPKFGSSYKPVLQDLAPKRANVDESFLVVPQSPGKQEGQLSAGSPKKGTFDSYKPVSKSVDKAADNSPGTGESGDEKVLVNGDSIAEQNNLLPASKSGGSTLSSLGSYPPNHRYHNCRESDNEDEMEEIDVDDYDEDKDAADEVEDFYDKKDDGLTTNQEWTPVSFSFMESRTRSSTACLPMRDLDGVLDGDTPLTEAKTHRSGYAHSVLSPVENLTQGELPVESQLKLDGAKDEQEHAVDASLSGWLVSSHKTPANKATAHGLEAIPSEISASSHGSNSVRSFSDRPILGALTMDELKQILASSSPRRLPSHNADDKPIIGTVGSHWSEETPSVQTGSVSSFKGIPNTYSKYREDKTVNWHSTPFETRLEQALKKSAAGVPY